MSIPESIPEDRTESYPCDCSGTITLGEDGIWRCDTCEWNDRSES